MELTPLLSMGGLLFFFMICMYEHCFLPLLLFFVIKCYFYDCVVLCLMTFIVVRFLNLYACFNCSSVHAQIFTHCLPTIICVMLMYVVYVLQNNCLALSLVLVFNE